MASMLSRPWPGWGLPAAGTMETWFWEKSIIFFLSAVRTNPLTPGARTSSLRVARS